jgi:hypothetical protein
MTMSNTTMLLLLLLGTLTLTSSFDNLPQQRDLSIMNAVTAAPKPTAKPYLRPDLLRRDSQVLLMAPDYTCGYVDGRAGEYPLAQECHSFADLLPRRHCHM